MTREEFIAGKVREYETDPRQAQATAEALVVVRRQASELYDRLEETRSAIAAPPATRGPMTRGQLADAFPGAIIGQAPTIQTHAFGPGERAGDKNPEFLAQIAAADVQARAWAEQNERWMEAHRLVLGGVPVEGVASTGPRDPDPHWRK